MFRSKPSNHLNFLAKFRNSERTSANDDGTFLYVDYCIGRNCRTRYRDATMRRALKQMPFDFISHSLVQIIDFKFQISAILPALLL